MPSWYDPRTWRFRSNAPISIDEWASWFSFAGTTYPLGIQQTLVGDKETIEANFPGYVRSAYQSNGVVFACMLVRMLLFSEARFQFQRMSGGRPGALWGDPRLGILENPWPGGTTGDLLSRAIQDADLAGNFYATIRASRLWRLRPDWVTIILGSPDRTGPEVRPDEVGAELLGYAYTPGGPGSGRRPLVLQPGEVTHFAPIPDPLATYRGMTWLAPVLREILADGAMSSHRIKFFENGGTPNLVVTFDPAIQEEAFKNWVKLLSKATEGLANAYKTMWLGGGASAEVVGANLRQLDFKQVQGAGETRIAAAAGVPPVIVGLSEGLQAATYSNYAQARRRLADGTMRPLWRNIAGSFQSIVAPPSDSRLWYDDRDVPFLKEDLKDAAEILFTQAQTIKALVEAGYLPEDVVRAVTAGDLSQLAHSGLFSVQLQPAGSELNANGAAAPPNGGPPQIPANAGG